MRTRDQCPFVEHEGFHREKVVHATVYKSHALCPAATVMSGPK